MLLKINHKLLSSALLLSVNILLSACQQNIQLAEPNSIDNKNTTSSSVAGYVGKEIGEGLEILLSSNKNSKIKNRITEHDLKYASKKTHLALETMRDTSTSNWRNPMNSHSGSIKILQTEGQKENTLVCRSFLHVIEIDGIQEKVVAKACRDMWNPDSKWLLAANN